MKHFYLIVTYVGLFLGICFALGSDFSSQLFVVSSVLSLINFFIYKFSRRKIGGTKSETPIFLFILFIFLSTGILFGQNNVSKNISQKNDFNNFISQNTSYSGIIYKIKNTENSQQLFVKLYTEDQNNTFNIKIITQKFLKYKVGDTLSFTGKISEGNVLLPEVENELNKSFDLNQYDNLQGVNAEVVFPKIEVMGNEKNIFSKFKNLKNKFVIALDEFAPRSVAALSAGTTLGDASLFSKIDIDNFRGSGLSHIIVLSGFNITVLAIFFGMIFLRLRIRLYFRVLLTILSIILFIIFVGAEPSILRAGIMGSMLLIATTFGRQYVAKQFLFLAAIIMIIINPKIALYDISFHLSFLATAAILYIAPILENYKFFQKENKNRFTKNIFEILRITLAVQILVTPYIMFTFGKVSLFGIFANILVVPFVPIVMLLGVFIILFSFLFSPLAIFFSYISLIFTKYIFWVAEQFSKIYISNVESHISLLSMILIYIIILFLIYFEKKRIRIKKYLAKEN